MARNDPAVDLSVNRVGAPPSVSHAFVKADRRALSVAEVEIEDRQAELPGESFNLAHDATAETAAARPRRDKGAGQCPRKSLRLVIARRSAQLRRAGDDAVQSADYQPALGHQQNPFPIIFQDLPRRRFQPTKSAALSDRALSRLAEVV